jgi:multidrug efflux pump subunit AcrA (membrane-fusion protein)
MRRTTLMGDRGPMTAHRRTGRGILALVLLAGGSPAGSPTFALAQEPAKPATEKAADAKPVETVAAEKGRFEVVFEAKGDFDPVDATVVQHKTEQWAQPLEIVRIVAHGTRVNAGDVLVELDTEKLDRAIADLDLDLAVGEKTLEIARRDLPVTEALQPLELAEAERDTLAATEDLARFLAVGRTLSEDSARFRLKASEEQLKYAREELRQLEKMYKDKDLTEETEEMILQRTRFEVESGEFNLRRAGVDTEAALALEVPRKEAALKGATEKAKLALEKTRATSALALEQKRLTLKKAERDRLESLRKMRELQQDRAGIPLKAPRSGIVYYGKQHDGAWTTAAVAAKAAVGQGVPVGDLVFTVVDPERVAFRVKVDEKDLHLLSPGLKGRVELSGFPDTEGAIVLESVSPVPRDGKVDARFTVSGPAVGVKPVPGMTGSARCQVYSRPDALTLPSSAIFRDEDGRKIVWLPGKDGVVPEKRVVKTGRASGGKTEILEGIAAGDVVRSSRP